VVRDKELKLEDDKDGKSSNKLVEAEVGGT
jgi:hypothetical protein